MKKAILLAAITFIVFACNHQDHPDAHAHDVQTAHSDDGRETESVTLFSEQVEVYAEYQSLLTGHESEFLIHVTNLGADYSPYTTGPVKLSLQMDYAVQNIEADPGDVDGIFSAHLIPEKRGVGSLIFDIQTSSGMEKFIVDHVHVYDHGDEDVHHHEAGPSDLVRYTKEQAWNSQFNIIQVKMDHFTRVVTTSGEFMAMPGEKQYVIAKSQGIVLFETRNLVQGKFVNKGEELFTLSGKGLADNNILVKFNESKTNFQISKSNYLRHQKLLEEKIISQRQFLETQSKYISDSIMYYSLVESVGDAGMKIHAPISGYLHELNVSEGQFVDPGMLMATISTNKVLLLRADVPQQYFGLLQDIQTTNFRPAYSNRVYTLEELSGKLIAKGASVAENNHYMPVYFEVVNDGTLLEGAFAEFYLMTGSEPGHLVIPTSALIEEQGNHYVYVQVTGEGFQKRAVDVVSSNGLSASVAGIGPGERIVSEGAMLVKTATSSAIPSHNHQH